MKYLFLPFVFAIAGCSSIDNTVSDYKIKPEDFKCPKDFFAYCEGRNPNNMECKCIDRRFQRQVFDRLTGAYL